MKKILLFLTLALLVSFSGFSQKYEGIQSLYVNADESTDPGDRAAGWLAWGPSSPKKIMRFGTQVQGYFNRFEPADLVSHAGEYITRVRYYWPYYSQLPVLWQESRIRVYTGGVFDGEVYEGNMVVDEPTTPPNSSGNKTVYLPEPILITGDEEIVFGVVHYWEYGFLVGVIDDEDPAQIAQYYKPHKSDLVMLINEGEDEEIFSLTAEGEEGYSWSIGAYATPYTWCNPVRDLEVDYVVAGSTCNAVLKWNAPEDNATAKYNVYRDGVRITSGLSAKTFTDKSGTGTNPMDPTKSHVWEVRAICEPAGNESENSMQIEKNACADCEQASNLRVSIGGNCETAKLEWDASPDAKSYKIYKGESTTPVGEVNAPNTTFELQGDFKGKITWKVVTVCPIGQAAAITTTYTCVGINENTFKFSIQPNPAYDKLTINASVDFNSVSVVNFLGQTVISQNNDTQTITLDVSNLPQGVYFVRIASNEGTSVQKFVKK